MSIAKFRSDHAKELKTVLKRFGLFLKDIELIGAQTIAVDSTKIRGVNSKGNNHTQKDVREYLAYPDEKSDSYLREPDAMDKEETSVDSSLNIKQEDVKGLLEN